jgi:ADP-ribosyl-[dinitrogen reductase] hydrolase
MNTPSACTGSYCNRVLGPCDNFLLKGDFMTSENCVGCILGTAVGDALGLPYEGLSRRRAGRMFGPADRHRLFFGYGMVSDDTEQTCMVVQSMIDSHGDADLFIRALAWRFRFWFLGLPAGIGFATLRSCIKLCIGFSPKYSGVFSAGNGPAVRAAISSEPQLMIWYNSANWYVLRLDSPIRIPKAEYGAFAVALAAQLARQQEYSFTRPLFGATSVRFG